MENHHPRRTRAVISAVGFIWLVCGLTAHAQQGLPAHSLPIAPGVGATGWNIGGPCPTGQTLIWSSGATADPTCGTPSAGSLSIGVTNILNPTVNGVFYGNSSNLLAAVTPVNNGILIYGPTGIPGASTTIPSATQANITTTGVIVGGTWGANISGATLTGTLTATGQTITGGTFSGGTWSGNTIAATVGGTGLASPAAHSLVQTEGASPYNLITASIAGRIVVDQGAGLDWAPVAVSGDAALAASGALTVTKTSGTAFGPLATQTIPCLVSQGCTGQTTVPLARTSAGLNIDQFTTVGNVNYQILSTDRTIAHNNVNHSITDTLPTAASVNAGQELYLTDLYGQFNSTTTYTVAAQGTDSVNGVGSVTAINAQYGGVIAKSDGISRWSVAIATGGGGGGGTVTQIQCAKGVVCNTITTTGTVTAPGALIAVASFAGAL